MLAMVPYKGWWQSSLKDKKAIEIDELHDLLGSAVDVFAEKNVLTEKKNHKIRDLN